MDFFRALNKANPNPEKITITIMFSFRKTKIGAIKHVFASLLLLLNDSAFC